MAYGKDPNVLAEISSFRQGARAFQAAKTKPATTGGNKPHFVDKFQPSTEEPDQIRVLKGNYKVPSRASDGSLVDSTLFFYPYVEHYHATLRKSFICSAGPSGGPRDQRQPCLCCDMFWADRNSGKKNGPMSRRDMYSFTVLHYAQYAKVEQVDYQTGIIRTNSEGTPYYNWQRVFPHERAKFAGKETQEARVLHWDVGASHWTTLTEYDKEIGKSCKACGTRDSVDWIAWTCRGCGDPLIEHASTTLSPKEVDELSGQKVQCGKCGHLGYMEEYVQCSNCPNGQRAEVFDVDLYVRRIPDPKGGKQTNLAITSWSNPRPIDPRFRDMAKPMDLPKIFTATPMEKQEEILGGARTPVTAGHSRPYGTPVLGGGNSGPAY